MALLEKPPSYRTQVTASLPCREGWKLQHATKTSKRAQPCVLLSPLLENRSFLLRACQLRNVLLHTPRWMMQMAWLWFFLWEHGIGICYLPSILMPPVNSTGSACPSSPHRSLREEKAFRLLPLCSSHNHLFSMSLVVCIRELLFTPLSAQTHLHPYTWSISWIGSAHGCPLSLLPYSPLWVSLQESASNSLLVLTCNLPWANSCP